MEKQVISSKFKRQGAFMVFLCSVPWLLGTFMSATSLQIFLPLLESTSGVTYTNLLNYVTIGNLFCVITSYFGGSFIEKYGCKKIMSITGVIAAINYFLLPSYKGIFVGFGILINASLHIMFCLLPTGVLMSNWYPRKNSVVMGICTAANTFSSLIMLPLFSNLIERLDVRNTMRIFSIPILMYFILCYFWIKEQPSDIGLDPDGIPMSEEEKEQFVRKDGESCPWTIGTIFRNNSFRRMMIGWGLVSMVMIGFSYVGIPTMTSKGLDSEIAVTVASFAGLVGFIGDTLSGWLGDIFGIKNTTIFYISIEAMGMFVLAFAGNGQMILIVLGYYIFMFMNGTPNNLMSVQCLQLGGAKNYAYTYKIVFMISAIFRALGTSICSITLKITGSYNLSLIIYGIMAVIGLILLNLAGTEYQIPNEIQRK